MLTPATQGDVVDGGRPLVRIGLEVVELTRRDKTGKVQRMREPDAVRITHPHPGVRFGLTT